ncbi:fimbrial protein [Pantoea sp. 1.19]|uniref:fimbrial protein n=1 Tax=Pantoea sp. 1.19 TaxID=1925589 RepID=UPI0009F9BE61|nr:fimbrial protein [Pantoea sp. 1.19]
MRTLLLIASLLMVPAASADKGATTTANIAFRGTLVLPPDCTLNNGANIEVDFTDRVGVNKIDGQNYRVPVNYQLHCESGADPQWQLRLSLSGTVAGFDKQALQTSKADLGIRIYLNDRPFTPGSSVPIGDPDQPPTLEAVPVKKPGATLKEGPFETWATLRADYY